jgi:hypothetical protein
MPKTVKPNTATASQAAPVPAQNATPAVAAPKTATPTPETKNKVPAGNAARKDQPKPVEPVSERSPVREEQEITLKYVSPAAREVKVAGNFNGWHPNATPLKNNGTGEWTVRLALRSGQYEYRFVVDGHWMEDPHAAQRGANPYGGFNSVLTVPPAVRSSIM